MLPDTPGEGFVEVVRTVRAHPDDVADVLADFLDRQHLHVDRSDSGEGTLFRSRANAEDRDDDDGPYVFGQGDSLRVIVSPVADGTSVHFIADLRGMHQRGQAWQRRRYVRGGLLAAFFIGLGVQGLLHGVTAGDFVPIGIGGLLGTRAVQRARNEPASREELERNLVNALQRACDEMEYDD